MLTKERTIEEHRKMWMWITRNIGTIIDDKIYLNFKGVKKS